MQGLKVFTYRDFRLYQCGRFFLTLAIQIQSVAVAWQVYDLTNRARDLGFVGLAQFLPMVGLSPLTGHIADRFDRRLVVLVCNLGIFVSSLLLLATTWAGAEHVYVIYPILMFYGAMRAFLGPANSALITHLVPMEEFPAAVAWSSTTWQVATVVGPALGGVLYGISGNAGHAYAVGAGLGLLGMFCVLGLRVRAGRMERKGTSMSTLLAGVRYVFSQKIVLGSITLDLLAVLLGAAVALLPIYARDTLHTGPAWPGLL